MLSLCVAQQVKQLRLARLGVQQRNRWPTVCPAACLARINEQSPCFVLPDPRAVRVRVDDNLAAIDQITRQLNGSAFGFNLIHSPNDPALEKAIVDLYIHNKIGLVEASAYMDMTLPVVRYRVEGIHRDKSGQIITPNRIIAKLSRVEVASKFFSPPPERFLRELVASGALTEDQAQLAEQIPMAQDVTAEANSGGHTDNRPSNTLFPTIMALRDRMQKKYGFTQRLRVGLAGGIATPSSAAAGFSMGAAYVMVGSVNQACIESGTTDEVREMLAQTRQGDITMAPAADMFEMGVTVQVLKRGTMFAMRGAKLYEIYNTYNGLQDIPDAVRMMLEKIFSGIPLKTYGPRPENTF